MACRQAQPCRAASQEFQLTTTSDQVLEKPVLERSELRNASPVGPRSSAGSLRSKQLDLQSVSSTSSVMCPRTPCGEGLGQAAVRRPDPAALFGDEVFGGRRGQLCSLASDAIISIKFPMKFGGFTDGFTFFSL